MDARRVLTAAVALAVLVVTPGCGSDDDASSTTTTTTAAAGAAATTTVAEASATTGAGDPTTVPASSGDTLWVLVSNDDGIGAKGLDVLVEALRNLPNTEVTVIAPKDNQSGTGSKTSPGDVAVTDATTISGYHGKAVAGFPSDAVIYALDKGGMEHRPNVVVTGINQGANVGPLVGISGTIGAARAGAQRGIPALASSQGLATEPDYASGVKYVVEWLTEHRAELVAGTAPVTVTSLNIPTCPTGAIRGEVDVPTAADAGGREVLTSDCTSTSPEPVDDVDGFSNGFATFSVVPNAA